MLVWRSCLSCAAKGIEGVPAGRVGQDHRLVLGGVLKVIGDAVVLEEAGDEVEVALSVLHGVGGRRVAVAAADVELDGVACEDVGNDLQDGAVLEDLAVDVAGGQPEARNDGEVGAGVAQRT
jgi:hypothetical protein